MSGRPVALVTGGARRVGLAVCAALAQAGCDIVVTTRGGGAPDAARAVQDAGGTLRVERVELGDLEGVSAFGARMARELARLDVLVHNASAYEADEGLVSADGGDGAHAKRAQAERLMRINALGPMLLSAALAPRLIESTLPGGGAIVALADIHAMGRPRKGHCAYQMSKAALVEMVRSLARDLAPRVRVNGVAPGVVAWPEAGEEAERAFQERYVARVPLARAGRPEDAAEAVRWLAMEARYITGQIVRVDGGRGLG